MSPYLSDKLKVLSFFSIILVLYIHSGFHNTPDEIQGMAFNHYLQTSISGMLGRCAVPLFYAISGYLFFLNIDNGMLSVWGKMKRRVKTLLIPFIIAACFFPAFMVGMELFPWTKNYINADGLFSDNFQLPLGDFMQSLFYKTEGSESPWAFHLWFLRDLIIIISISPLLYYLRKANAFILLTLFFLIPFFNIKIGFIYALFWFLAGSMFLSRLNRVKSKWILPIFVLLSGWELVFPNAIWDYLQIPIISLGIIGFWHLYDALVSEPFDLKRSRRLYLSCQFSFFIYLFHEPTLNVVRKLLTLALGRSSAGFAINYLISPWVFACLFIVIGYYFRKFWPRLYAVCVGGR